MERKIRRFRRKTSRGTPSMHAYKRLCGNEVNRPRPGNWYLGEPFSLLFREQGGRIEEVCEEVVEADLAEVTWYRDDSPEERIHVLVDHVFVRSVITRSELGVILELVALSMHRSKIREKLDRYNREMMAYLTDLFEQVRGSLEYQQGKPRTSPLLSGWGCLRIHNMTVGWMMAAHEDSSGAQLRIREIRNPESASVPSNVLQRRSRTARAST